ncbi:MAG: alpha/beta hydrolase [Gemmatimonadota bacterium]
MTGAGQPRPHEIRREDVLAGDGARLALYRLGPRDATPVVLMPGTFTNHTFWLGTQGRGLAWNLAAVGYEAVVLDPRGHGRLDAPAAIQAATADRSRALLVGHSAGGAALLMALAAEPALRHRVAGVVALGTPVPWLQRWRRIGARAIRATSGLLGRFPARVLGLGPEDELAGVMVQWMTWNLAGEWRGKDGIDYGAALHGIRTPVLGISGAGDTLFAPPEACRSLVEMLGSDDATYRLAGVATGFSEDFDHSGIVVSRMARREVWPVVVDWLDAHRPA